MFFVGVFRACFCTRSSTVYSNPLISTNSLSDYFHCASPKTYCLSICHSLALQTKLRVAPGFLMASDSWQKNKLMCNLPEQVSCIYCRVFDLLQTWELPRTCVVGCRTLFKGTLTVDVEEYKCISHLLRGLHSVGPARDSNRRPLPQTLFSNCPGAIICMCSVKPNHFIVHFCIVC